MIQILDINKDMTAQEMRAKIKELIAIIEVTQRGFHLSVNGYDQDPRDLWEIPKAIALLQRVWDTGLAALLEPSSKETLGALEVWMIITGRITHQGQYSITQQIRDQFIHELMACNRRCRQAATELIQPSMN